MECIKLLLPAGDVYVTEPLLTGAPRLWSSAQTELQTSPRPPVSLGGLSRFRQIK